MKRLVLLGEGHGEVTALPTLIRKLLQERGATNVLYVDPDLIRTSPSRMVRWDKATRKPDYSEWARRLQIATRRREVGGILAVYDGDAKSFPAGSASDFCAATAARSMAAEAIAAGAGKLFSLSIVFACVEYETWLVAGAESFAGRQLRDGRLALPRGTKFPAGNPESHGKRWLEQNCVGYRPTRDQGALTELLDLQCVRSKQLRSFKRLENALDQLVKAVAEERHISTPF